MADNYPDAERADDLDSLLAQVESMRRAACQVASQTEGGQSVDLLYLEEKARNAERAAAAVAQDARLIYDRQGGDTRWLGQ